MRTKVGNLPHRYMMIIDISPKNAVTIKVKKGEAELTLIEQEKYSTHVFLSQVKADSETLDVQISDAYQVVCTAALYFETGEIILEYLKDGHHAKEDYFLS
ncbi:MAG: hypothetical protein IJ867_08445 [Clostridia bacterium]|nr:hypothetical protein [Clostridia bacterium]